jgi:exonuclease SbcD
MRLLHTSDWHVGKTLARRSRLEEAKAVLGEVADIAQQEEVDAVLVCGDLFEYQSPLAEAESVVYETLLRLEALRIPVLIICGNHDHPAKWRAIEPLLARFAVYVVPQVRSPNKGGILELPVRNESAPLQVAALPWVHERRLVGARELMGCAEQPYTTYTEEMKRLLERLCASLDPGKCHVLAAHLFVSGSVIGGGERSLTIGQLYAIDPQVLPMVQYVALGHVHRAQRVPNSAVPSYYPGSLLQLDFGEVGQRKSVTLVDLQPGQPARVREVPLTQGRCLRDVAGTLEELEQYRGESEDEFLRVFLSCDGPRVGLGDQVRELLPNAVEVRLKYTQQDRVELPPISGLSPREQFVAYWRDRRGADPEDALLDLLEELLREEQP